MELIIILLMLIVFFVIRKNRNKSYNKKKINKLGEIGESRVKRVLRDLSAEYYVFNDVYLLLNDTTIQIDHIIISKYGIFVIETKNYSGWIYGHDSSEYWIENMYGKKYKFYNPLKQNNSHIVCLKKLLNISEEKFIPIVVFTGEAELKVKTRKTVLYLGQLKTNILNYHKIIFENGTVEKIVEKFSKLIINDKNIEDIHIKNIQNRINRKNKMLSKNLCPNCGGELIERKGPYGKFFGCSNYPKCKFSQKF